MDRFFGRIILLLIFGVLFHTCTLYAQEIVVGDKNETISLLSKSAVYISNDTKPPSKNNFRSYKEDTVNTGISRKSIWVRFRLKNPSDIVRKCALVVTSPLLEEIVLYRGDIGTRGREKGVVHMQKPRDMLYPYYLIELQPRSAETFYLQIRSKFTPVDFSVKLMEPDTFFSYDKKQQHIDILLIGFVLALALYSLLLFLYIKDKSYLYYSLYLLALIYQQVTYLGLTQVNFPIAFIHLDMQIPVIKIGILLITSALFAVHFLKIEEVSERLYRIYRFFITVAFIEMLLFAHPSVYDLNIVVLTGALFIVFNLYAGIFAYRQGETQARLFIVGFGIVFVSYVCIILDAIGVTSIMQQMQNILMFATAFEALILSLAFADRYILLQREKQRIDAKLLSESQNRTTIIQHEVEEKTKALNQALETKETLLREIQHRVKNNLQIILSMIRLQNDEMDDAVAKEKLKALEFRIKAISQIYDRLLFTDDLERIDMSAYIETLLEDIAKAYDFDDRHIVLHTDINAKLALKDAIYVGLIVNELVTNAYKYAFEEKSGSIEIVLDETSDGYVLRVEDSGSGGDLSMRQKGLGRKLIDTLVRVQLKGEIEMKTSPNTSYTIRFK